MIAEKRHNLGFTMVEMVVVMAILAIMVGIGGLGLSLASSRNNEQAARTIEQTLGKARNDAMTKNGTFEVTIDRVGNRVLVDGDLVATLPVRTEITFFDTYGNPPVDLNSYLTSDPDEVTVTFDKSTGRVQRAMADGTEIMGPGTNGRILRIQVTSQNSSAKVARVVLVKNTGKYFIEYGE